jgi:hypothetical protein
LRTISGSRALTDSIFFILEAPPPFRRGSRLGLIFVSRYSQNRRATRRHRRGSFGRGCGPGTVAEFGTYRRLRGRQRRVIRFRGFRQYSGSGRLLNSASGRCNWDLVWPL